MITLRDLLDTFVALPDSVLDKPINYIDISNIDPSELEDFKTNLIESTDKEISLGN